MTIEITEPYAAISHRQEEFSGAYIRAICAAAGCSIEAITLDNDKIDYVVRSRVRGTQRNKPQIDIQAKCQMSGIASGDRISYSIDLETYDSLRDTKVCIPRILILVLVPADVNGWMCQTEQGLVLNHCAYWISLKGLPDSENLTSQTVYFPRESIFGASSLKTMMSKTADGVELQ
jgi:hypothetical protein